MPTSHRSALYWFVRVAVAVFVLSAWMTVAVSTGVARADSPPPSEGGSTSEGTRDGTRAAGDSPAPAHTAKKDSSTRVGDLRDRLTRHLRPENRIRGTDNADRKTSTTKPSRADVDPGAADEEPDASADLTGEVVKPPNSLTSPKPAKAPRLLQPARSLQPAKPLQSFTSLKPVEPPKPRTLTVVAPAQRDLETPNVGSPSIQRAAAIAPADPVLPNTPAGVGAADVPQLGRQAAGLISDVGVVAVSVVYTVADAVAQAFGPNDFLGVPYALATALANTAAAAGRTLIGAPLDAASPGRFPVTYGVLDGLAFFNPQKPPPGANDPSITVTDEHPLPIILLNGTTATQGTNWSVGAPVLANAGYKVYTFNYGNVTGDPNSPIQATGDIRKSADELDAEIDRVLEETGAEKVILIGHSQGGGILPAYYINNVEGGAEKVSQVIGIAPSNHGTDFNGLVGLLSVPVAGPLITAFVNVLGPAFIQQTVGSDFQDVVYGEQDTDPRVLYTNIITRNDEIVTPYTQQALEGDNVTNIVLQDRYPGYPAGHLGVVLSPQVWSIVLDALEANPEANPQLHPAEVLAA